MTKFEYHGDDLCPKCGAVYCANGVEFPAHPTDKVVCMGCHYEGELIEFVEAFNKEFPDFADQEVDDGQAV